jgi:hypothetical protein
VDWFEAMLRGDFESAWRISDGVLRARAGTTSRHLPRHEQWVWDGTPLDGKRVLIRCYHGLGDTIQFLRYAPLVRERASEVIVWAQPQLVPLLRTIRGIDRIEPLHDGAFRGEYDVDVESMELPFVLRTTIETVPREVPYIDVEPLALVCAEGDRRPNVGIVWRAGEWDERRWVPFGALAPILDSGVRLYSLQRDADEPGLIQLEEANDVVGTARAMKAMDLVISADTMTAHLAGAVGVPVWTLLPATCDWRWMRDRETTPWYPTMRLFRQERPGEWAPVISRVAAELARIAVTSSFPRVLPVLGGK